MFLRRRRRYFVVGGEPNARAATKQTPHHGMRDRRRLYDHENTMDGVSRSTGRAVCVCVCVCAIMGGWRQNLPWGEGTARARCKPVSCDCEMSQDCNRPDRVHGVGERMVALAGSIGLSRVGCT